MTSVAVAAPSGDDDDQALLADAEYVAGRLALKAEDDASATRSFQSALKRLPRAADLHDELGFTHRRLRHVDRAFDHYRRALDLNPQHRSAQQYIGEAYLMIGDVERARWHLAALRSICFLPRDKIKDLELAIFFEHLARAQPLTR